ncbi:hypothetical protein DNU06_02735 [Putridiphycobacter roseus]|uniref:Secretion system C-terminal sorting domain-containing protein n=1 Tax=Putridiphycobacter roseus TaxID=2219161 RepID=A0A2W1NSY8_9FLAO|nr:T9SS type A sorting domain-containing protein [Putridiphycobacter roseus]PZE18762.1 hypothetical protein DNU06_02735 [Putridiphycobacter roseus]
MSKVKFYSLVIFLFFMGINKTGYNQINAVNWGVSDTNLFISKNTDYGTVHDYLALYNYSGQDLQMRWVKYLDSNWPTWWGISFTDPANYHTNILNLDSADFTLTDPVGFSNKLIIGVDHQAYAWYATAHFKVFPVLHREDTLWLHYNIEIAQGNATATISQNLNKFKWQYLPSLHQINMTGNLTAQKSFTLFNLAGQKIMQQTITTSASTYNIKLPHLKTGVYFIQLRDKEGLIMETKKFIF